MILVAFKKFFIQVNNAVVGKCDLNFVGSYNRGKGLALIKKIKNCIVLVMTLLHHLKKWKT